MELAQQIGQTHGELHRYGALYEVYSCWQWTTLKVKYHLMQAGHRFLKFELGRCLLNERLMESGKSAEWLALK